MFGTSTANALFASVTLLDRHTPLPVWNQQLEIHHECMN